MSKFAWLATRLICAVWLVWTCNTFHPVQALFALWLFIYLPAWKRSR